MLKSLHRLTESLNRTGSLKERYPYILADLQAVLEADRVAILVSDDHGVMRFESWIGLSDEYRRAVDGHSPWPLDAENPQSIWINNVSTDERIESYRPTILKEGVRAMAFIPLVCSLGLVGKFMVYYNRPHEFTLEEIHLSETAARVVAYAIERQRSEEALRSANEQMVTILESITDAFYAVDREWRFTYVNRKAEQQWRRTKDELLGKRLWDVFPEAVGSEGYEQLHKAMKENIPVHFETFSPVLFTWVDVNVYPSPTGLSSYFRDISERKLAEQKAARMHRRATFLAEASRMLSASLDYETTLKNVAALAVPAIADWCQIDICDGEELRLVALAHRDGTLVQTVANSRETYPPRPDSMYGALKVVRTSEPLLISTLTEDILKELARDDLELQSLLSLQWKSYMCVPMRAREQTLGAISFLLAESGGQYDPSDLEFAQDVASRAALAVDNARLFAESVHSHDVILAQLKEKEVLIKEIHHRVKNNLQIISSLLSLQSTFGSPTAREALRESRNRIRSMALIHEQLYRSDDLSQIDLGRYIHELVGNLYQSYQVDQRRIGLNLHCDHLLVDMDKAVCCGLVINEIVTNSFRHAFPENQPGNIDISLCSSDSQIVLKVADDGIGLPADILPLQDVESLGLRLISMLVRQIEGQIEVQRDGGTSFTIRFS